MLRWFLIILGLTILMGVLGFAGAATLFAFAGIAVIVAVIAEILFWILLVLLVGFAIGYFVRQSREAR